MTRTEFLNILTECRSCSTSFGEILRSHTSGLACPNPFFFADQMNDLIINPDLLLFVEVEGKGSLDRELVCYDEEGTDYHVGHLSGFEVVNYNSEMIEFVDQFLWTCTFDEDVINC